jgi:hypothetical protein
MTLNLLEYFDTTIKSSILRNVKIVKFKDEIKVVRKFMETPIAQNKFKRLKAEPIPEKSKVPA